MYSDFRQGNAVAPHPERYPLFDLAVTENVGTAATNFSDIARSTGYELRLNAPAQDILRSLLDFERQLLDAQLLLVQIRREELSNFVTLYIALGAGWQ